MTKHHDWMERATDSADRDDRDAVLAALRIEDGRDAKMLERLEMFNMSKQIPE